MADLSTRLIERQVLGGDMAVFRFEKPEHFDFKAGQWSLVTVPDRGLQDERGLKRPFSIASSPLDRELVFATKLSGSAMKRTMAAMEPGTQVLIGTPMGVLLLPDRTDQPLVFLAGGVGITPFRSMIRYSLDADTGHTITLFYSTRTPEETPFLHELLSLRERTTRISPVITMTRAGEGSAWKGLTGRLNPEMVRQNCEAWEEARYYIVGPAAMADAMKQTLGELGIEQARITLELFTGA